MEYTSYVESTIYKMLHQPTLSSDIKTFLLSIHDIVNHTKVKKHFNNVVNNQWSYDNCLKLINQRQGILTLIQYIVLLLFIMNPKLKYINQYHEQIILKILFYLFFVIVPQQTSIIYTIDEKINILYYCMNIYAFMNNKNFVFYCFEDCQELLKPFILQRGDKKLSKKIKTLQHYIHILIK